jgi:hypothetical protein
VSRVHDLKCWPEPFAAVASGAKTYEIRVDDRGYMVGDVLVLKEWDPAPDYVVPTRAHGYTGRSVRRVVTYKTPGGAWSLPSNLCVLSLAKEADRAAE